MNLQTIIGVVLLLASAFSVYTAHGSYAATEPVPVPAQTIPGGPAPSSEGIQPKLGGRADYANGWNILPVGASDIPAFWRRYKVVVGDPIGAFDASNGCQPFQNARLCISDVPGYEVEISNSGEEKMQRERLAVNRGAPLHPAVRALIDHNTGLRIERNRAVGDTLSRPICENGQCRQFVQKVVYTFREDAKEWDEIQMEPVEERKLYPPPAPKVIPAHNEDRPIPPWRNWAMLGFGLAAGAAGLGGGYMTFTGLTSEDEGEW